VIFVIKLLSCINLAYKDEKIVDIYSMNQTFGKEYKLCSHVLIEKLFKDGEKFRNFPFLINYLVIESLSGSKDFSILISVPKKLFKHAHDRNYIKRSITEALRKNKFILEEIKHKPLALAIIYNFNTLLSSSEIETKLVSTLMKFALKINQN
jgi:ribonuclease P protein component